MTHFWAKFKKRDLNNFRYDTRIYLNKISHPESTDNCIGAIVGKNPGSANPIDKNNSSIQEIRLDGDKLLPTVKNIIRKSYIRAGVEIPNRGYIQVLNLFYLCNPILKEAIFEREELSDLNFCLSENKNFPWVWYLWGGDNYSLNNFKKRFKIIKADTHFFFNQKTKEIKKGVPSTKDFARHTQGLKHSLIVPFISELIKNSKAN